MTNMPLPKDRKTRWIFLSPHLDDAVFSCGGLISYLSENGIPAEIWTVFSDQITDPSQLTSYARSLHDRWQTGDPQHLARKNEDALASTIVGTSQVYLGFLDCIYRFLPGTGESVVMSDDELFRTIKPGEQYLISEVASEFKIRMSDSSIWVCPLGMGHHIDHQITRIAAEASRDMMLYYADLPYAITLPVQTIPGMIQLSIGLPEKNVMEWGRAILQYSSQLSTFWKDAREMTDQYSAYLECYKGMPLWLPNPIGEGGK